MQQSAVIIQLVDSERSNEQEDQSMGCKSKRFLKIDGKMVDKQSSSQLSLMEAVTYNDISSTGSLGKRQRPATP